MKGIKKCLLLALSFALSATLFAACGGGNDGGNNGGSGSDSEVKLPDISVEVPDVEDIDGAPVANADEWNTIFQNSLSATNATIVTTATSAERNESGVIMIAGGITYDKWSEESGDSYNFWGEVDGQSYHWQSEDGKTWTYEETARTPADYATVAYELEGMDEMLTFAGSTWNAETGMYTGDTNIGAYSLKISDGKVVYIAISADSGMMAGVDIVYQILYGQTAAMELPALGGGDENTQEEAAWLQAWENTNKATNLTANGSMTEVVDGVTRSETAVMMMADGKSYCYYSDEEGIYGYEYYGTVDGRNYCWASGDNETWEVKELSIDIARFTTGYSITGGMEQAIDFSQVTYEDGYYSFAFQGMNFRIKIDDNYIVEFGFTEDDGVTTFTITYGNATVGELPPLPQIIGEEVKDATEWASVLENTMEQMNFICTVKGRSERDGKVIVHTEYTAVDNGKVYMESETLIPNGNTAVGTKTRTYQGYVNGVAYEWVDIGGSWDVREIDVIETSSPVEYVGLADWDFAAAKFDAATGAYAFEADGESLKVKVVDGLVAYFELNAGGFFSEYTITYGNANVDLPPLNGESGDNGDMGGNTDGPGNPVNPDVELKLPELIFDLNVGQGIVGEEVSAEIFKKAITEALGSTNFTIQGKSYVQGGASLIAANIANGKHYSATKATYPTQDGKYETTTMYTIISTVDGTDWVWMSFDGVNFDNGPAEGVVMAGWKDGNDIFGMYLQVFLSMDSHFNAATGEYSISADGVTVAIKIVNNEVKTIYMTDGDMYILYVLTYDNAVDFNLPPVTDGGSGDMGGSDVTIPELEVPYSEEVNAKVWEKAIAELRTATNFSMQATDTTATPDYSVTAHIMMQIADNKGYATAYVQGRMNYAYVGNVDGKNYEWNSENGKKWECICTGDAYAINGEYFLAEVLPVDVTFASVYFNKSQGGYQYEIDDMNYIVIGFTDGQVSFIKSVATSVEDGVEIVNTQVFVLSYGDAYVGELPPVENVIDGEDKEAVNGSSGSLILPDGNNGEEQYPENDKVIINNQYAY